MCRDGEAIGRNADTHALGRIARMRRIRRNQETALSPTHCWAAGRCGKRLGRMEPKDYVFVSARTCHLKLRNNPAIAIGMQIAQTMV
jgi:hypothetical protein